MKNNKVWYIGYLISVVSLIISFAGNHRKSAFIALVIFAAVTFCVTHIMVVHNKMLLKNEEYKMLRKLALFTKIDVLQKKLKKRLHKLLLIILKWEK